MTSEFNKDQRSVIEIKKETDETEEGKRGEEKCKTMLIKYV